VNLPDPARREVIEPELLPRGGPNPRRAAREARPPPGAHPPTATGWLTILGTSAALDLMGLVAKGPLRWLCAIAGAGCAFYLAVKLRAPARQWGWISLAGALYASYPHARFIPVALVVSAWRLWFSRPK
jgi:hypothetical protein